MTNHVLFIAGEVSGDIHAAPLISHLKNHYPDIQPVGVGGKQMAAAGMSLLYPLAQFGVTGFVEVIKQFGHIWRSYRAIKSFVAKNDVPLVVLVDYPGFNLRMAKFFKKRGAKIIYYICPQVWAWKPKRIDTIKAYVDELAVILPFEKKYFEQRGIKATYVGHPLTPLAKQHFCQSQLRRQYQLNAQHTIIGLLPGSRHNEVNDLIKVMYGAAKRLVAAHPLPKQVTFILPLAPHIDISQVQQILPDELNIKIFVNQDSQKLMACCDQVVVASGTASLEAMLLRKPTIIIYRTSLLTYLLASQLIQVKYLGLGNLIAGSMICPEILQSDLTCDRLSEEMLYQLNTNIHHSNQQQALETMIEKLNATDAKKSIFSMLDENVTDLNNI